MLGLMMDRPLLISSIARHAELQHPGREIVSVTVDHPRHRYTYADAFLRARKLANSLQRLGVRQADRVATLAWNDFRHLEIYFAVSGSGFVCHTINPCLFEEQIVYIVNHAEDRWLFLDPAFVPLVEKLQDRLPHVEGYIVLCDDAHMPATRLPRTCSYETLIASESRALTGRSSMSARPARFAIPQARPAIRKVCSTVTAPSCCIAMPRRCRMRWA